MPASKVILVLDLDWNPSGIDCAHVALRVRCRQHRLHPYHMPIVVQQTGLRKFWSGGAIELHVFTMHSQEDLSIHYMC
eukprot:6199594-Pleurochrysis_carterae.AAC.1